MHFPNYFSNLGQFDGQRVVLEEAAEVVEGEGYGLDKVILALEEAAIAIGAEGLEDTHEDVAPEVSEPVLTLLAFQSADIEIMVEEVESDYFREVAFGAVEQRGHIILCCATTASLIIYIIQLVILYHYVAALEVAVEEVSAVGLEEEVGEAVKIILEKLLVERIVGELEKMVLEVVEIPEDGLTVEVAAGIGHREVHIGAPLLDGGEVGEGFLIKVQHFGVESPTLPFLIEEEAIEGLVAEVLLEVAAAVVADGINLRHRQAFGMEVTAVGEEGLVLADVVVDATDG